MTNERTNERTVSFIIIEMYIIITIIKEKWAESVVIVI
jgi:hypothetical protein